MMAPRTIFQTALLCFLSVQTRGFHQPQLQSRTLSVPFHPVPLSSSSSRQKTPINANSLLVSKPHSSSSTTELQALASAASSPVGAFLILTGIIVVHECGHYLAARSYGIKVEEFSIGVGPKLAGFTAYGNEFNFRAIPLGGYVRFPENYNITLAQEQEREVREAIRAQREENAVENINVPQKKTLGYRLTNLLSLGALDEQRKQDEKEALIKQQQQQEEKRKQSSWWNSLFSSSSSKKEITKPPPIQDPDDLEIEYYDDPDLLQNRPWFQRAVVLSGGVVFNLLLAFSIYFGQMATVGLPQPVFEQGILVSQNPAREAAADGLLRKGDIVLGVNGKAFAMSQSPGAAASQQAISNFISDIRATPDGYSLQVSILRNKQAETVSIQPKRVSPDGPKTIGVLLTPNFIKTEVIKFDNPVQAVAPAAKLVSSSTKDTAAGLFSVFGQAIAGKDTGGQQVSGPIGLIKTGSDVVASNNWPAVLAFAAAISINLGVVNALPLPALDGGQLVFVLAEAVTRRKVPQKLQEEIIGITVLLLLLVSVNAALGDIQSLIVKK
ncbi:Probable membrane metalloprotease ARASP2, chloroplastic [Seminavis robusta]|uniref:Probable membrane metalloprotease ARASP2, chloroplastic n=1 Tax=Seminavis robusta TaxID=568900 RepID=A0A9N8DI40_9STRA|nr:Probable membrane metalloprotease ARASP2, chloroplastic [Seminavis robusta]|eukprot:Sro155_g070480.1 Probable membrane metalloprotease ARASP2, chloroplastic (554) ;mRNA; f:80152-81906